MIKDSGATDPDATEGDTTSEAEIRARRGIDEILARWGIPAITCIAVLAGTILRFWPRSSLWLDEALSVNIAALPLGDLTEALRHDGHPPLYYLLLHVWMKVFGDSDWAVRALSGVISLASLPLAYLAGLRMARRSTAELSNPRRVALIAVAVTATMPFAVRYGAEARMYSLVMLLVLCGYLVVDTLLAVPTTPRLVLPTVCGAFVTALLLWTHYWSMWLLGAVGILALVTLWSRRDGMSDRQVVAGPIAMIISLVVGGLLYLPWVPTMAYQASHTGTPWGESFGPVSVLVLSLVDFAGARFGVAQFFSYILVVFIVCGATVVCRRVTDDPVADGEGAPAEASSPPVESEVTASSGRLAPEVALVVSPGIHPRVRVELGVLLGTLGLGWAAAAASGNTFSSRYASVVFPLFVLVVTAGIAVLRSPRVAAASLVAVCLMGLLGAYGATESDRTQAGAIVDAIAADMSAHPGPAAVVSCPDQLGVSLQREVSKRAELADVTGDVIPYPTAGDPRFVDWVDYGSRNSKVDATEFIEKVRRRVGSSASIYLVASPHYKTFEGQCENLTALFAQGGQAEQLVAQDTSGLDESASLTVIRPG